MRFSLELSLCLVLFCTVHTKTVSNRIHQMFQRGLAYHSTLAPTVCPTEECRSAGQTLKASLNESVDPCDDFYEFACGQWVADQHLKTKFDEITIFGVTQKLVNDRIKDLLSSQTTRDDSKSVAFVKDFYKTCVDIDSRRSAGAQQIHTFLASLGGWPLMGDHFDEHSFDWQQRLAVMSTKVWPIVFNIGMIELGRSMLIFNEDEQLADQHLWGIRGNYDQDYIDKYKQSIIDAAIKLGAKNETINREDVDELVKFQEHVSDTVWTHWRVNFPSNSTLQDLTALSNSSIDWVHFINQIYQELNSSIRVNGSEEIAVESPRIYKYVPQIVSQTPKRVIANYLGWSVTKRLSDKYLPENVPDFQPLSDTCLGYLTKNFPLAVSKLYADEYGGDVVVNKTRSIISDLKGSFEDIIKSSDWLDTNTSESALKKLSAIKEYVAYPQWILDNNKLDDFYNIVEKSDPKNFLANAIYFEQWKISNALNDLGQYHFAFGDPWDDAPYQVDAYYNNYMNSITIPIGILSPPYFDASLPTAINYGGIGSIIGHELTHGFDTTGSRFDESGHPRNWWTDSVREKFDEKAECFKAEYRNIVEPQSGQHLNGNNTVGEDIADNGGVQESYRAYQKFVQREAKLERLPVIDKYSAGQQFFISMAHVYCAKYSDEEAKSNIEEDSHSLHRYRVNLPLSNFRTFADVFKCSADSPMNRKDKCVLW